MMHAITSKRAAALCFHARNITCLGQPSFDTHPHLLREGYLTPGISKHEYALRRDRIMEALPENSTLVLAAAKDKMMSHDVSYDFRQDTDFNYVTGFQEPGAIAVLVKGSRTDPVRYTLFVPPKDASRELWDGPRSGVEGAMAEFGVDEAFTTTQLTPDPAPISCAQDGAGPKDDDSQPPEQQAEAQGGQLPDQAPVEKTQDNEEDGEGVAEGCGRGASPLVRLLSCSEHHFSTLSSSSSSDEVMDAAPANGYYCVDGPLHALRAVKSEAEQHVMARAGTIAAAAHRHAMQCARPGMTEQQVCVLLESSMRWAGAQRCSFPSVVAGGPRACTLHYVQNNQVLHPTQLVLVDGGAELHGYASDVTRTWPIDGRYTTAQRELYEAVLDCERQVIAAITNPQASAAVATGDMSPPPPSPPTLPSLVELNELAQKLLTQSLLRLGVAQDEASAQDQCRRFFPHGVGHQLGMDVHDVSRLPRDTPLQPGMVVTVEPGLYIPEDALDVPPRFRGIGIRVEDDVAIDAQGRGRVLTSDVPTDPDEIEALVGSRPSETFFSFPASSSPDAFLL